MEGTKDFWVLCISLALSLTTFIIILIRMGTQVGRLLATQLPLTCCQLIACEARLLQGALQPDSLSLADRSSALGQLVAGAGAMSVCASLIALHRLEEQGDA
jgi:hypothetical protein